MTARPRQRPLTFPEPDIFNNQLPPLPAYMPHIFSTTAPTWNKPEVHTPPVTLHLTHSNTCLGCFPCFSSRRKCLPRCFDLNEILLSFFLLFFLIAAGLFSLSRCGCSRDPQEVTMWIDFLKRFFLNKDFLRWKHFFFPSRFCQYKMTNVGAAWKD